MVSMLEGSLAKTITSATKFMFLDAVLTRYIPATTSTDPADPDAPTQVTYTCKAFEESYSTMLMASGQVNNVDVQILILAQTLAVEPQANDQITVRGKTYSVIPPGTAGIAAVQSDPARATWKCRCT